MKNSCPQWDSNTGPSTHETKSQSVALLDQISIEHLNGDHVEFAIKIYLYHVPCGRCSKMFCRVLPFINSLQSANVLIQNDRNII